MLNFPQIRQATEYIIEKNKTTNNRIVFSITTNGSLINEKILEFMNQHSFLLLISFDGVVQDLSRNRDSFDSMVTILKKTLPYPKIDLETNSVFTPSTIGNLSKSILSIIELGIPNISFALSQTALWDRDSLYLLKDESKLCRKFSSHSTQKRVIFLSSISGEITEGAFFPVMRQEIEWR